MSPAALAAATTPAAAGRPAHLSRRVGLALAQPARLPVACPAAGPPPAVLCAHGHHSAVRRCGRRTASSAAASSSSSSASAAATATLRPVTATYPVPETDKERSPIDFPQVRGNVRRGRELGSRNDTRAGHDLLPPHPPTTPSILSNHPIHSFKQQEWVTPQPTRRPDTQPEFEKLETPMPKPLPGDPEAPDDEAAEEEERKKKKKSDDPDNPDGEPGGEPGKEAPDKPPLEAPPPGVG
jgi:hypothetical protein